MNVKNMPPDLQSANPTTTRVQLADPGLHRQDAYANGQWLVGHADRRIGVVDPWTSDRLGSVPNCTDAETALTIGAAQRAFESWRVVLPKERREALERWYTLIHENKEDLASLITLEQGKPISEARAEVDYAASFVRWFAQEAERINVESVTSHLANRHASVQREPIGVVAAITPWNFPSAMITRKAGAAIAAGCSVIVRPATETPFSALALAELADRAEIPAGVFSVLTGDPTPLVDTLCADPRVRGLSFTGSTEVGRLLIEQTAQTVKRLSLELGGHAPFIVFPDCDVEEAARQAVSAKFQTSGQDCLAANRIYVHQSIYDRFCDEFVRRTEDLQVGDPFDADTSIGPLMHERAVAKCQAHVDDALAQGARLLTRGEKATGHALCFPPTVLAEVTDRMAIADEETFGPVAGILRFADESEVIERANHSVYGLMAYIWTNDLALAYRVRARLEFGMIGVNTISITGAPIPFGGMKQSGIGREGSRHGLEEFTDIKYVCTGIADKSNVDGG